MSASWPCSRRHVDDFNIATWQPQIEGGKTGRELPAIVDEIVTMTWIDFGDRKPVRAFVCTNPNLWGYPAKDRSGRLDQLEPPNLGALIEKLTGPGQRKPFPIVSSEHTRSNLGGTLCRTTTPMPRRRAISSSFRTARRDRDPCTSAPAMSARTECSSAARAALRDARLRVRPLLDGPYAKRKFWDELDPGWHHRWSRQGCRV